MLGVDYGAQRIGIAVSEGSIAVPLTIVEHQDRERDLARVALMVSEQAAAAVVVGLPMLESGDEGEQARRTRRFGDALARRIEVPVLYHDERFSSASAEHAMSDVIAHRGRSARGKRRLDAAAAAVILQSYIDAEVAKASAR